MTIVGSIPTSLIKEYYDMTLGLSHYRWFIKCSNHLFDILISIFIKDILYPFIIYTNLIR